MDTTTTKAKLDRHGWTIADWSAATGVGRSSVYNLLRDSKITGVKLGSRTLITTHPRDFLATLPEARTDAA